jgi:hypothetical protein
VAVQPKELLVEAKTLLNYPPVEATLASLMELYSSIEPVNAQSPETDEELIK